MLKHSNLELLKGDATVLCQSLFYKGGQLYWVRSQGQEGVSVKPTRLFPWSEPLAWISLRNEKDEEVRLVGSPSELDPESREALALAVAESSFLFAVERILSISEEYQLRVWRVITAQGERVFQTDREDWPRLLPNGCRLIADLSGDLYSVPPLSQLDAESRRKIWPIVE